MPSVLPAGSSVSAFGSNTAAGLRKIIRDRVDMPLGDLSGGSLVSDSELNGYINESLQELADILIGHYGDDYFVADPYQFTTNGADRYYPLPFDFAKALGLDLQIDGGNPARWVRVQPFNFGERNRYAFPAALGYLFPPRATNLHYRIRDNYLWLEPQPAAGMILQLHYVPLFPTLADMGNIDVSNADAGDSVTVNGKIYFFATTPIPAPSGAISVSWNADRSTLAEALTTAITANDDTLKATSSGSVVSLLPSSGNENGSVLWTSSIGVTLSPSDGAWCVRTNSRIAPWLAYVTTDCAIKVKGKQEEDVSLEMAQKAALVDRIETAAQNRDAGGPITVTDVRSTDYPFGGGWGSGRW